MILTYPSYIIEYCTHIGLIEKAGRLCYKSEGKIGDGTAIPFVKARINRGHESILEHSLLSVRFIVNRGVTHELVRHRIAAFSQESTRWVSYKGGCEFIVPPQLREFISEGEANSIDHIDDLVAVRWLSNRLRNEEDYCWMLNHGWPPEEARGELPLCTKTEILVSTNFREWRHILSLRAIGKAGRPHPHMKEVMEPLLEQLRKEVEPIFNLV